MIDAMEMVKKYIALEKEGGTFDFLAFKDILKKETENVNSLVGVSNVLRDAVLVAILERWVETSKSMPTFDHELKNLVSTLLGAQGFSVVCVKGSVEGL